MQFMNLQSGRVLNSIHRHYRLILVLLKCNLIAVCLTSHNILLFLRTAEMKTSMKYCLVALFFFCVGNTINTTAASRQVLDYD